MKKDSPPLQIVNIHGNGKVTNINNNIKIESPTNNRLKKGIEGHLDKIDLSQHFRK